ncbi:MAG TPA: hypothetical protein VFM46_05090, partial [Pseudomonadales bacterium]|nr:hypothetical protein [Pseudomonadales bacterium]
MLELLLPAASSYGAHFNQFNAVGRALRDAPAEAVGLLAQRYAEIRLADIAEELVKAGIDMLEILALGAGVGGALGALAGALTGGIGIAATTTLGVTVGAEVALMISGAIGVVVAIEEHLHLLGDAVKSLWQGLEDAWHAGEAGVGELAYELKMAQAKHNIAFAIVILAGMLLEIIIAVILKKKPGLEKFKNS